MARIVACCARLASARFLHTECRDWPVDAVASIRRGVGRGIFTLETFSNEATRAHKFIEMIQFKHLAYKLKAYLRTAWKKKPNKLQTCLQQSMRVIHSSGSKQHNF